MSLTQTDPVVNKAAIKNFLSCFFREGEQIQVASGNDQLKTINNHFVMNFDDEGLDMFVKAGARLQLYGHGVFFRCQLMGSNSSDSVQRVNALFADMDFKGHRNIHEAKKEAFLRLKALPIAPSIINETKNGLHAFWIVSNIHAHVFKAYQDRLHTYLRYNLIVPDGQVKSAGHLLRLPGFNHLKDPEDPFMVTELYKNYTVWTIEALETHLPKSVKSSSESPSKNQQWNNNTIRVIPIYNSISNIYNINIYGYKYYDLYLGKYMYDFKDFVDYINSIDLKPILNFDSNLCCPFHRDNNPSASYFIGSDGGWKFRCHSDSCQSAYTMSNIQFLSKMLNMDTNAFIIHLCDKLNVCLDASFFIEQTEKLYKNMSLISYMSDYDGIDKVFGNYYEALEYLHEYQIKKMCWGYMNYKGKAISFISNRFLAKALDISKAQANRLINSMCQAGLIHKVFLWNVPPEVAEMAIEMLRQADHNTITFYTIPEYNEARLRQINADCERMEENGIGVPTVGYDPVLYGLGIDAVKRSYIVRDTEEEPVSDTKDDPEDGHILSDYSFEENDRESIEDEFPIGRERSP